MVTLNCPGTLVKCSHITFAPDKSAMMLGLLCEFTLEFGAFFIYLTFI